MSADDVYDLLEELSYGGLDDIDFDDFPLTDFATILHWISKQLHFFAKTDSIVQPITGNMVVYTFRCILIVLIIGADANDFVSLKVELNSLLEEVGSIYHNLFTDNNKAERLAVVCNLAGHLIAARVQHLQRGADVGGQIESSELNPRKDLKFIKTALEIPDETNDVRTFFAKVNEKLNTTLLKVREEDSLLLPQNSSLTSAEWADLKALNEQLRVEYGLRREMLLRRADTTVNSFTWKNDPSRAVDAQKIKSTYNQRRQPLIATPAVTLSHALAARSSDCSSLINDVISTSHANCVIDAPSIKGTANQGAQQRLQLHKYIIGNVPDRGGRPFEQRAPTKETFEHQRQQRDHSQRRGGGRGGRGGGGGNFHGGGGGGQRQHQDNRYRNIPDNNRVQGAGWQQGGGGGGGYHQGRQHHHHQDYDGHDFDHRGGDHGKRPGGGGHRGYY